MREVAMTIHNQCRTMRYVITVYFEKTSHYCIHSLGKLVTVLAKDLSANRSCDRQAYVSETPASEEIALGGNMRILVEQLTKMSTEILTV